MVKEFLSRFSGCNLEDMEKINQIFIFYQKFSERMKKEVTNMMTIFGKDVPNPPYFEMSSTMQTKVLKYIQDRQKGIDNE